jgi:hypothetical protein
MQSRAHIFDSTLGVTDVGSSWLDRKVLQRELTDSLNQNSLNQRKERASQAAETFLGDLSERAQRRNGIERRSEQIRRQQEEILKRQADEYRQRLRKFLPAELRD